MSAAAGTLRATRLATVIVLGAGSGACCHARASVEAAAAAADRHPAECLVDATADAAAHPPEEALGPAVPVVPFSIDVPDLDGDGASEVIISADAWCGTSGNCYQRLYLSGAGCVRHALTLVAQLESVQPLATATQGVQDVSAFEDDGCAGQLGTLRLFRWDRDGYTEGASVRCGCPDEEGSGAVRDDRCP
ncbi:MAG: hypothetical protein H6700_00790 [Myxococcales bacterium]|nr:hypothetical protein [Myxococcales bacterium]